jgi:NAD(P)-dependent dehydrogenase (short-subunit alcohol dehydrogenase family)
MPDFDLTDRVAIVTGGSRGIGEATAAALADQGARVVISSRKPDGLQAAADRINARRAASVTAIAAHVGRPEDSERLVSQVMERFGRIDILVNNAGTNPHFGPILDVELSAWDKTFEVNLRGPLVLTKFVVAAWMRAHGGAIVNVASVAGLRSELGLGPYGVSKAALIMLSRQLATELGPLGIRVNAVAPSIVKTEFAAALWGNEEIARRALERNPLGRFATTGEVASTIVFLVSDAASYVNGEVLPIDGGE